MLHDMKLIAPLFLTSLALAAAGCGSDNANGGSQPSGASSYGSGGTVIKMQNIAFDPKEQTVKVGQKVRWENEDNVDHNVVAREGANFSSKNFTKGGTYSFTPRKAGKIEYTCTLHPGMDGELTVTG
jgi:plastocyanin